MHHEYSTHVATVWSSRLIVWVESEPYTRRTVSRHSTCVVWLHSGAETAFAMPSDAPSFQDLLRRYRRNRNLTQEALAERAGISVRAISDLERGVRTHPYPETANLLADGLDLEGEQRASFLAAARRRRQSPRPAVQLKNTTPLPLPHTRLVGRDEDLSVVIDMLHHERTRLLTLSGPAGVGKTRLAIAAASRLHDAFADGIVFVDLAPVREPSLVLSTIAAALGLRDQGTVPLAEALRGLVSNRHVLLVIDNFEHLLPAAPVVSELLQSGPNLQMLVTSRGPLRLRGEREYPVGPLPTPPPAAVTSPDELMGWPAIRLFLDRAEDALPGFHLTESTAPVVAAICHRLEGLPLALELSAFQIKLLTPEALLARLEPSLPLLTGGMRDAPPRQRTLEAAIAWSYDVLSPDEQALFRCLGVFVDGWTLAAAEAVSRHYGVANALASLAALREQSLIYRVDEGSEPRYRMLETVREFALAQQDVAGDEEQVHQAYLDYLFDLVRENAVEPFDGDVETRLARLKREDANVQAGIAWAIDHRPETALKLTAALGYYWFLADRPVAGRAILERVLTIEPGPCLAERAQLLQQAAWLAAYLGDFVAATPLADEALALAEHLGDRRTAAHAMICQGHIATYQGKPDVARVLLETTLAEFESLGDVWGQFFSHNEFGNDALHWGDVLDSIAHFERLGAIVTEHRLSKAAHATYLFGLASSLCGIERYEEAYAACSRALVLTQDVPMVSMRVSGQVLLGQILLERGEVTTAATFIAQTFDEFWQLLWANSHCQALETAAAVLSMGAHAATAVRLLSAAAVIRDETPYPMDANQRGEYERLIADLRNRLGAQRFTTAWRAGQDQPLNDAVAEAQRALATMTA